MSETESTEAAPPQLTRDQLIRKLLEAMDPAYRTKSPLQRLTLLNRATSMVDSEAAPTELERVAAQLAVKAPHKITALDRLALANAATVDAGSVDRKVLPVTGSEVPGVATMTPDQKLRAANAARGLGVKAAREFNTTTARIKTMPAGADRDRLQDHAERLRREAALHGVRL
jgi:hypothetical protein